MTSEIDDRKSMILLSDRRARARAHTLSVPARLNDWEIYTNISSQMRIPERDDVGDFISRGLISRRANLPVSLVRAGVRFSIFHPAR